MVRECASSHSPHHGTVSGRRSRNCARSVSRRASTRTGSRTRSGFWTRCSVRSTAGHPCARADSTAPRRLSASRVPSFHASVTAAKISAAASLGSDGDSIGGFKWSRCGTPGGCRFDTVPVPPWDGDASRIGTRGSQIGTGGSRIGTRRKVWCKGVIQIVAGRASRAGVVELWTPADEATRFQIPKCAQDCASAGIGFGHQGANRGVAREVLVRLIRQEDEDELRRRGTDI